MTYDGELNLFAMLDEIASCTSCAVLLSETDPSANFDQLVRVLAETYHRHHTHHVQSYRV